MAVMRMALFSRKVTAIMARKKVMIAIELMILTQSIFSPRVR